MTANQVLALSRSALARYVRDLTSMYARVHELTPDTVPAFLTWYTVRHKLNEVAASVRETHLGVVSGLVEPAADKPTAPRRRRHGCCG